ncbi:hypothetical protein NP233_g275 [Leucocoprinus birnbaumii]|uniref:Nephrocystin 3-like N-terminal domain-containing protein n=1 Tax=Leucocoprinus birnbaumii TaxID=56174 RepID=A0AAD5W5Q4_9AGAR|nr:hypothetical protein NP233_g275 [Leucocoprinus birnbaumii]
MPSRFVNRFLPKFFIAALWLLSVQLPRHLIPSLSAMPLFTGSSQFKVEQSSLIDSSIHIYNVSSSTFLSTFKENSAQLLTLVDRFLGDTSFAKLETASLPQAMHDTSARHPPRCFPGTREKHLRSIAMWGRGEGRNRHKRVLWMQGPSGVGKSAVAQTWVDEMKTKFAAAFFFSRVNHWNHPDKFFPTIAYQLAIKYPSFRRAVCASIAYDPFIFQKSIKAQCEQLLIKPLGEMDSTNVMA